MTDRFKFRVWDIRNGEYFKDPNPTPPLNSDGTLGFTYDKADFQKYYIIEQCTGLSDKNGKLIYEDDILEISMIIKPSDKHKAKVYYNEKKAVWQLYHWDTERTTLLSDYLDSQIEIIGNIHETKEETK